MTIDVMIPTYRPESGFYELLRRLSVQSMQPGHIFVINTEERHWDERFERDFPNLSVRHIAKNEFDHGGTRHAMALGSDADLMLFMTQDALPANRHLIEALAGQFSAQLPETNSFPFVGFGQAETKHAEEHPGQSGPKRPAEIRIAAAYARQLPRPDCSILEKQTRSFNYPKESCVKVKADLDTLGIKAFFCSNVCAMYDRQVYLKLGGFPQHTIFNEDMIYARRLIDAGYGIAYSAEAEVVHSHNYTGSQQFHRNFDLAVSQAQFPDVFADVPAEGEGLRMIRRVAGNCVRAGKPWLIAPLIWQSGCKYAGYSLGKHYRLLPKRMIKQCSQNHSFW